MSWEARGALQGPAHPHHITLPPRTQASRGLPRTQASPALGPPRLLGPLGLLGLLDSVLGLLDPVLGLLYP